ncbi:MAG: substrate-binding domain-containing protein [Nostoc sp. DedVER02]|uniref:substrate-binding domain-containing protein n=1 Tax=unclassified Nostoc TaxID=2593658 RepID=UPI002AD5A0DC|nr:MULTISPECIES: substrate-binding domain-containing protein [unclassified Nostoc]MDZ7984592.1 substrate-binding domain-containing protein [Nostoc sp. DedVER02]MDZ8114436.1 substrate-binding domain-containing protein [Nostoc sp. DedVER01b]
MSSESNVKLTIALSNPDLDAEEQERETQNLLREIKDLDVESRSKREVVILDCCFSGAFAEGWSAKSSKDDGFVDVRNQLGGEGRAVLTSSTSTQYSFAQPGADVSTYTRYVVEGLETGAADRDQDSFISVDELHEYAKRKVQEAAPAMKPEIYAIREGYKIKLAKAPIDEPKLQYGREVEYWVRDGEISNIGRTALSKLQKKLGLPLDQVVAKEAEVLKPYQDYKENLQEYQKVFLKETKGKFPVNENTRDELKRLQQTLGLRDEDIALIEASQKRRFNLTLKSIGMLSIGVIIGAVAGWFIKPDKKCPPVIPPPPIKVINQFVEVPNVPEGTFKYGGSTSWAFIYPKLESEIKKAYPPFNIKIRKDLVLGSGIGIEKLIDGGQDGLDFALSSRDVSSEEEFKAKKKLFTLKAIPVVKSGLAVAVNPQLAINALTKEQLSKIFSGKINNWRQAGTLVDIPIKFYVRGGNSTSTNDFRKSLDIIDFGENINYVNSTSEGLQKITKEPGGIFVGPISDIVPQCGVKTLPIVNKEGKIFYPYQRQNFVSPAQCHPRKRNRVNIEAIYSVEYPLPTIFYVVVKQNGQREQQAGQAYANLLLTKQGQEIIKSLQETGSLDENN